MPWVQSINQQWVNRARALRRLYYARYVSSVLIMLRRRGIYGLPAQAILERDYTYRYLRYIVNAKHNANMIFRDNVMQLAYGYAFFPWDPVRYRCPQLN